MNRPEIGVQIKLLVDSLVKPDALSPDMEKVKKMSEALVKANEKLDPLQQAIYNDPDKADRILSEIRGLIIGYATPFMAIGETDKLKSDIYA